jgi:membrane fusion protein (multidrug efflux system)
MRWKQMRRATLRCVAASLLIVAAACGRRGGFPTFPPPDVSIVTVAPEVVPLTYEFSGQVVAFRRVEVRARVDGIILERPFAEGALVKQGQVLYRLDRIRPEAAYQSASARLVTAKRALDRLEPLLQQHAVAQQDVDNARAAQAAAQAAMDQARKDMDDTQVKAEMEGRVGRTRLEVGARVTGPGDLLTTIDRLDPVYVSFRPASDQVEAWESDSSSRTLIQPGSALAVRVMESDNTLLPVIGRLDFVAPSQDAATGTQEMRATVANANHALVPGQFVRVRLEGFARSAALAVPLRAVQSALGRQFVYIVGPGDTAQARDIKPGPWSGNRWIIDSGLKPGDRVIVDGVQKVGPGRPVHPVALGDSTVAPAAPARASSPPARAGNPR